MAKFWEILDAECCLERKKAAYLKRFGWQHTSDTPGFYVLWRRDFADVDARRRQLWEEARAKYPAFRGGEPVPIGVMAVPLDLAVNMTRAELDPDPAETPHEEAEPALRDCVDCGKPLSNPFFHCDEEEGARCGPCFEQHPCGKGEHGEGCPTQVHWEGLRHG